MFHEALQLFFFGRCAEVSAIQGSQGRKCVARRITEVKSSKTRQVVWDCEIVSVIQCDLANFIIEANKQILYYLRTNLRVFIG